MHAIMLVLQISVYNLLKEDYDLKKCSGLKGGIQLEYKLLFYPCVLFFVSVLYNLFVGGPEKKMRVCHLSPIVFNPFHFPISVSFHM